MESLSGSPGVLNLIVFARVAHNPDGDAVQCDVITAEANDVLPQVRSARRPPTRIFRSYRELAKERADIEALLVELAPAWAELRKVLNELNWVLEG